jgi:hypothetical protein
MKIGAVRVIFRFYPRQVFKTLPAHTLLLSSASGLVHKPITARNMTTSTRQVNIFFSLPNALEWRREGHQLRSQGRRLGGAVISRTDGSDVMS